MATPITGAISLLNVRSELGASGAISFNDTLFRQLTNQLSGTANLGNARACASVNSSVNNLNVLTGLFGSSGTVANFKVLIRSGVNVDATAGNTALVLGQFGSGSTIVVNNYGSVRAFGGAGGSGGVGSAGGDAIFANYSNQTVTINNQSGAFIYGGGGGGGRGGNGGTGGTGGGGQFSTTNFRSYDSQNFWVSDGISTTGVWNNAIVFQVGGAPTVVGQWVRGDFAVYSSKQNANYYGIGQTTTTNTNGGAGGGGGNGGAGGRGLGADGAAAGGSNGAGGSAGSGGGTNAGTGGTGGAGGSGSTWGTAGNNGNTGATGNTGASGNRTGGSAGSAGAGGSSGGAAGRYLVRGGAAVTINNSGTVAGGLA